MPLFEILGLVTLKDLRDAG